MRNQNHGEAGDGDGGAAIRHIILSEGCSDVSDVEPHSPRYPFYGDSQPAGRWRSMGRDAGQLLNSLLI
jgi:hypothetical protein